MRFYDDLYCKNDSMHDDSVVTIVDNKENLIYHGTIDMLDKDFVGNENNPVKNVTAQWLTYYATVYEYHITAVSTTAPSDVCAVPLTAGLYISELYVKVSDTGKLKAMLNAHGLEWGDLIND